MGECGEGHFRQEDSAGAEICRDKVSSAQLSLEDSLPRCSMWSWGPVSIKTSGRKLLEARIMLRLESLQYLKGLAEPMKELEAELEARTHNVQGLSLQQATFSPNSKCQRLYLDSEVRFPFASL